MSELDLYDFDLPQEFIAQQAAEPRDSSRLLVIHRDTGRFEHRVFRDLPDYLRAGDVLVLNQTRVIPARLHARKIPTGGLAEILLIQKLEERRWLALVGGKRLRVGSKLAVLPAPPHTGETGIEATVVDLREESQRVIEFNTPIEPHFDEVGEAPLPPYIHEKLRDPNRYQTVYARTPGSVAAPTAGLHFTPDLLARIAAMGVTVAYCTLHVGLGTFLPVREDQIQAKKLHSEYAELSLETAQAINACKANGGRVIGVGTTSVRTLESAALRAEGHPLAPFADTTDLFIMPGFQYRVVDAMVTNFHLPRSSLMLLVATFAGRELILNAYETAKREGYRFYSLGDATLIL